MIVSSEVILGYTTLGLLLSVLAQTIARRSLVRSDPSFRPLDSQENVMKVSFSQAILAPFCD
jgi:hypothetical protein